MAPPPTREHLIRPERLPRRRLAIARLLHPDARVDVPRPRTRADCAGGERLCPWVSCRHHLYLDYAACDTDTLKLNFPDREPWELADTCALDVADRGGEPRRIVAGLLNVTEDRVRQLEKEGMGKVREAVLAGEDDD